jgi:hypothetical protein
MTMDDKTGDAVNWLLSSAEPAVRLLARRDLLGEDAARSEVILDGSMVRTLLSGQCGDGGFGVHPYRKWKGAHWRLVSLVELGIPPGEPRALRAADTVLDWLTGREHRSSAVTVDGLVRCHASQEGNALAVCSRLGLGRDPRVELLAESLVRWQWPDGGWNCDVRADGRRSSFHESLAPAWGLFEYWRATGEAGAREAAFRTSLDPLARREFLQYLMEVVARHEVSVVLSSHLVSDLERVCDYLVVLVASRVRLAGDVSELLASHHRLSGPRRDPVTLPASQEVIEESHTDRQSTLLVRTDDPILDPSWTVRPVSLEDLVLAYMSQARDGEPPRRSVLGVLR